MKSICTTGFIADLQKKVVALIYDINLFVAQDYCAKSSSSSRVTHKLLVDACLGSLFLSVFVAYSSGEYRVTSVHLDLCP